DELGPAPREWKEGLHHRGQRVAGADEPLSLPRDVGEPPGKDLHERDDAVRRAFLDPHDEGIRSEDLNQEERQDRHDHLAADVGEEGHDPEDDDIRGESVREGSAGGRHGFNGGGWKKNATAITAYTMTSNAPSYQLLRPSEMTAATTAVARANDASSKISKSSVMTLAVSRTTRTLSANRFSQRGCSTTSVTGLKMSRCVRNEKNKPNTYAKSRIPAMPRLISSSVTPDRMPVESTYRAGMTSPMTATTSIVIWIPDASREK